MEYQIKSYQLGRMGLKLYCQSYSTAYVLFSTCTCSGVQNPSCLSDLLAGITAVNTAGIISNMSGIVIGFWSCSLLKIYIVR
jgi:hypothetical protein